MAEELTYAEKLEWARAQIAAIEASQPPAPVIEAPEIIPEEAPEPELFSLVEEIDAEAPAHRALKTAIVVCVLILALAAGALTALTCGFVEIPATASTAHSTELQAATPTYAAPVAHGVPNLAALFGLSATKAEKSATAQAEAAGATLNFTAHLAEATDDEHPSIAYASTATLTDEYGDNVATLVLAYNANKRLVYAYAAFDLDALCVADAPFAALATSNQVATGLLATCGVEATIETLNSTTSTTLTQTATATGNIADGEGAVAEGSVDSEEAVAGSAGESEEAAAESNTADAGSVAKSGSSSPEGYRATLTYDHTIGATLHTPETLRTLTIELF